MRNFFKTLIYFCFLYFLVLNINAAEIEPVEGYSENPKVKEAQLAFDKGIYFSKVKHDCHEAAKSLNLAADIFLKELNSPKDAAVAYSQLGLCFAYQKDFEQGIEDLEKAIELNSQNKEMAEKVIEMCKKV